VTGTRITALVVIVLFASEAHASPPCNTTRTFALEVESVTIDGAEQSSMSPSDMSFAYQDGDPTLGTYVAVVYDPDTAATRTLFLRGAP